MSDLNQITMLGRLTRDPQLKYLANQTALCEFGIAAGEKWRTPNGETKEKTCFVECVIFGKRAEALNQYFQKGKQILISGRLDYQTWEDKNGGGKRSKHVIQVNEFNFTGSKDGNTGQQQRRGDEQPAPDYGGSQDQPRYDDADIPF